MFILSQDKTRIFNTQGHIEGIGYEEENFKKGKKEEIRHTIQVFDGCAEEIAEYECKEDCLLVLYAIFKAIEQGGKTAELPAREEMKEQREALKQYLESGKRERTEQKKLRRTVFSPVQRVLQSRGSVPGNLRPDDRESIQRGTQEGCSHLRQIHEERKSPGLQDPRQLLCCRPGRRVSGSAGEWRAEA